MTVKRTVTDLKQLPQLLKKLSQLLNDCKSYKTTAATFQKFWQLLNDCHSFFTGWDSCLNTAATFWGLQQLFYHWPNLLRVVTVVLQLIQPSKSCVSCLTTDKTLKRLRQTLNHCHNLFRVATVVLPLLQSFKNCLNILQVVTVVLQLRLQWKGLIAFMHVITIILSAFFNLIIFLYSLYF